MIRRFVLCFTLLENPKGVVFKNQRKKAFVLASMLRIVFEVWTSSFVLVWTLRLERKKKKKSYFLSCVCDLSPWREKVTNPTCVPANKITIVGCAMFPMNVTPKGTFCLVLRNGFCITLKIQNASFFFFKNYHYWFFIMIIMINAQIVGL